MFFYFDDDRRCVSSCCSSRKASGQKPSCARWWQPDSTRESSAFLPSLIPSAGLREGQSWTPSVDDRSELCQQQTSKTSLPLDVNDDRLLLETARKHLFVSIQSIREITSSKNSRKTKWSSVYLQLVVGTFCSWRHLCKAAFTLQRGNATQDSARPRVARCGAARRCSLTCVLWMYANVC